MGSRLKWWCAGIEKDKGLVIEICRVFNSLLRREYARVLSGVGKC